ncbi:hypothetical protein ACNKHO_21750 [Shigella flexneri]
MLAIIPVVTAARDFRQQRQRFAFKFSAEPASGIDLQQVTPGQIARHAQPLPARSRLSSCSRKILPSFEG